MVVLITTVMSITAYALVSPAPSQHGSNHQRPVLPGRRELVGRSRSLAMTADEAAAKAAWLAKQDVSVWGRAEDPAASVPMAAAPDAAAADIAAEDAAKVAWLAKQDAPTWGRAAVPVASAPMAAAQDAVAAARSAEDAARAAWLATQDAPAWGGGAVDPAASVYPAVQSPVAMAGEAAAPAAALVAETSLRTAPGGSLTQDSCEEILNECQADAYARTVAEGGMQTERYAELLERCELAECALEEIQESIRNDDAAKKAVAAAQVMAAAAAEFGPASSVPPRVRFGYVTKSREERPSAPSRGKQEWEASKERLKSALESNRAQTVGFWEMWGTMTIPSLVACAGIVLLIMNAQGQ